MRKIRKEINTSSMADIAFLLIVFFLVATTIDMDTGLQRRLPPYIPDTTPPVFHENNILSVKVNAQNEIMINRKVCQMKDIRKITGNFLTGEMENSRNPETVLKNIAYLGEMQVSKGIISLQNDRGTSYDTYIRVMNEIIAAGNQVKDKLSIKTFNAPYDKLSGGHKKSIDMAVPCILSEAEPRRTINEY